MPSGHLNERYVKHAAVEWLANYYTIQLNPKAVVPATEVGVRKNSSYGKGRADGLITVLLDNGIIHTISMEAKSARTWHNIRIHYSDLTWIFHILVVGITSFLSGLYLGNMLGGGWFLALCMPIVFLIAGITVFITLTYGRNRYQTIPVVNQIKGYPANERWIALSTDVFNRIEREKQYSDFENACQHVGIGLLRVSANKMVTAVIFPRIQSTPKKLNCYLECYAKEQQIRGEIYKVQAIGVVLSETVELEPDEAETNSEEMSESESSEP
jgi:hypothetical protein